jgi:excisionase family DNA binding protein
VVVAPAPAVVARRSRVRRIPRADVEPTVSIEEAAGWLGVSRQSAYKAAAAGELPVLRIGRRYLVKTAALRRMLHLPESVPAPAAAGELPVPYHYPT